MGRDYGHGDSGLGIESVRRWSHLVLLLPSDEITPNKLSTPAKELAIDAGTGWDVYAIQGQFLAYARNKGKPEDIDAAFIGFVKKKISTSPH